MDSMKKMWRSIFMNILFLCVLSESHRGLKAVVIRPRWATSSIFASFLLVFSSSEALQRQSYAPLSSSVFSCREHLKSRLCMRVLYSGIDNIWWGAHTTSEIVSDANTDTAHWTFFKHCKPWRCTCSTNWSGSLSLLGSCLYSSYFFTSSASGAYRSSCLMWAGSSLSVVMFINTWRSSPGDSFRWAIRMASSSKED